MDHISWRLVSQCYQEVVNGNKIHDCIFPKDTDWQMMTATFLAWHRAVVQYVHTVYKDRSLPLVSDVLLIKPTAESIMILFEYILSQENGQDWKSMFHTLFDLMAVFVLPDSTPVMKVMTSNYIHLRHTQRHSLDQMDSWLYGEAGKRRATKVMQACQT